MPGYRLGAAFETPCHSMMREKLKASVWFYKKMDQICIYACYPY
jgi:hypothetical protein